jgi:hypothetical protein
LPFISKLQWLGTGIAVVATGVAMLEDVPHGWGRLWIIPFLVVVGGFSWMVAWVAGLFLRVGACVGLLAAAAVVALATIGSRRLRVAKRLVQLAGVVLGERGPRRFGLRSWMHRWTVRPARVAPSGPLLAGTMASPVDLRITLVQGRSGDMLLADAVLPSFEIRSEAGERVEIEIEAGSVLVDRSLPRQRAVKQGLPPWLERAWADDVELCSIPVGTTVELTGGERSAILVEDGSAGGFRDAPHLRVVRGTSASPIAARFGGPSTGRALAR